MSLKLRSAAEISLGRLLQLCMVLLYREKNNRIHMHTLSGLLHAHFCIPNLDYLDILKAVLLLTQDMEQVVGGYRRMVFNVLTHNRDDHSKDFAFLFNHNQ